MGGSDDPSNLIKLTVEEHALAHKKLYEQYGKREDYIAWKMLSGQMKMGQLLIEKAKLGGKITALKKVHTGMVRSKETKEKMRKKKLGVARSKYSVNKQIDTMKKRDAYITRPDGTTIYVENLRKYCRDNQLNRSALQGRKDMTHKGHKLSFINRSVDKQINNNL
jgi:hypothetical protein